MKKIKKVSFVAKYFFSVLIKWSSVAIVMIAIIIVPVILITAFSK